MDTSLVGRKATFSSNQNNSFDLHISLTLVDTLPAWERCLALQGCLTIIWSVTTSELKQRQGKPLGASLRGEPACFCSFNNHGHKKLQQVYSSYLSHSYWAVYSDFLSMMLTLFWRSPYTLDGIQICYLLVMFPRFI